MKWSEKGHEFDRIYNFIKESIDKGELHIWGGGYEGKKLCKTIKEYKKIYNAIIIVDSDKEKKKLYMNDDKEWLPIIQPDKLREKQPNIIVLAVGDEKKEDVKRQYKLLGLDERCVLIDNQVFIYIFYYYFLKQTYIHTATFSVTQKCTLNCTFCSIMTPFLENKKHYSLEVLKKDLDIFFQKVDVLENFHIIGGEPFIYPDLKNYIEYIASNYMNQIVVQCDITTNGTVLPDEDLLNVIAKYKGVILISDYSDSIDSVKATIEKIGERCNEKGIEYIILHVDKWVDFGNSYLEKKAVSCEKMIEFFDECRTPCRLVKNGNFYFCVNSNAAVEIGLLDDDPNNFYDLVAHSVNDRNKLMEFDLGYNDQGYIDLCRKCNGYLTINKNYVRVAEQYDGK